MTVTRFTRPARSALALAAAAALLGLSACGSEGGGPEADSPASSTEASDGGGEQSQPTGEDSPSEDDGDPASDEGGTADDRDEDDAEDPDGADGPAASGERTRIMLVTDLGLDDATGDGPLTVTAEDLAGLLTARFDAPAECADDLVLEQGGTAGCEGPAGIEQSEPAQEWTAHAVRIPHKEEPMSGSQDAVLFTTGGGLPESADDLLEEDAVLTGVGFGSAFGLEPLSAEQLASSTLDTLTSEFAYVPVQGMADWSEVTCEDGLDFARFETVDCEATTAGGERWDLSVAPGTYADNDQGLLVGIEAPHEE